MTQEEYEIAKLSPMCRKCCQRAESVQHPDKVRHVMTMSNCHGKPVPITIPLKIWTDLCFYHTQQAKGLISKTYPGMPKGVWSW